MMKKIRIRHSNDSKGSRGKRMANGVLKSWDAKKTGPSKVNKGFGRP